MVKKLALLIIFIIAVASLVFVTKENNTQKLEKEIGVFVVRSINYEQVEFANKGGGPPPRSIYIQYASSSFPALGIPLNEVDSTSFISAWKYDGSQIIPATQAEIVNAIDQKIHLISFTVRQINGNEALVDMIHSYPRQPRSGGEASHWTLHLNRNEWEVTDIDYYFFWD